MRPQFEAGGRRYSVWDFAYLSKVDEIYPGLLVRPICGHELCVHPEHIRPRRRRNVRPTKDAVFFALRARQRYLNERRQRHRDLSDEQGIAEAYGLEVDLVEEWSYEFRKRFILKSV